MTDYEESMAMSLPCCFTDEETPYCASRRFETLPMCKKHMHETMRAAVLDALMPWDVVRELVSLTSDMMAMRRLMERSTEQQLEAQRKALRTTSRATNKRKPGVVYYVRLSGHRIKIGRTTDLKTRMKSMRVQPHDVLAAEPGGAALEADRHKEFADIRHGRLEDFDATPELLSHIESIRAQWGNPWQVAS
jgi:hypothetical protein